MSLTITIPGAVEATIGATAPAVLTIGVGTPGATGPAGPAGPGVPVGGTAGQYLQKIDGTNYNTDWVTLNLAAYAPLASPTFTGDPQAPTPATSDNDTSIATTAFVKAQGYLTSAPVTSVAGRTGAITLSNTDISGLGTMATASASNYSTTAVADTLYAPIAAGLPTGGTVGQVLTKNSGTNFDASFATLIPGDRYLTTSTTSLTINNANKTLTIGTGLSYTTQQDVIIAYDATHHMHCLVTAYNSGTGVMDVDVISHTGTGTYASWTVNVGGTVPVASIVWGDITGTLGNQTDLATALNSKLETSTAASTYSPIASPTFTGTVTIPAGASISGFAPLASPSLTGTPLSTTAASDTNTTQIATTAFVVGQASATTPAATGTAAVGTSLKYARADHAHANPLPTGGTTGQVLSKVDGTNYNVQWSTASGGGGGTDYQAYTTAGTSTWTKPANAKWVEIYLWGGGGGGGSGARYATSSSRGGGGGGAAGSYLMMRVPASTLGATESVVVGAAGTAGASQTADTSGGNAGGNGGTTTFSSFQATGGGAGGAGSNTTALGGSVRAGYLFGVGGLSSPAAGTGQPTTGSNASTPVGPQSFLPTSGGGGAGAGAGGTSSAAGGNGGAKLNGSLNSGIITQILGGVGGTTAGVSPTAGVTSNVQCGGGTGGGGGAYITAVASMAGAVGGFPSGGGGGGSASDNGFASGAGGAGAVGAAYIITYC